MTSTVRIDSIENKGKSFLIKSGDKTYFAKLDSGLGDKGGQTIEAETKATSYNGKDYVWIEKWKSAANGAAPQMPTLTATNAPQGKDNITPWWMPFVSNSVAHAVQAGHCGQPSEIQAWADAAYRAAVALKAQDGAEPF